MQFSMYKSPSFLRLSNHKFVRSFRSRSTRNSAVVVFALPVLHFCKPAPAHTVKHWRQNSLKTYSLIPNLHLKEKYSKLLNISD